MKRTVLILVSADPRKSGRPAEAVRVAAGLSVHERLAVTLCLCHEAVRILGDEQGELFDGDDVKEYLAVLQASGAWLLALRNRHNSVPESKVRGEEVSAAQLNNLVNASERVLRF